LYPDKRQLDDLAFQLEEARRLYNAAIQERKEAWDKCKVNISIKEQSAQLKWIRDNGYLGLANFSAAQNILRRVHQVYNRFYKETKKGIKTGYPRFKTRMQFNTYVFPAWQNDNGCRFTKDHKLYVQGVGNLKIKLHRKIDGKIKCLILKYRAGRWYAILSTVRENKPLLQSQNSIGMDVGIRTLVAFSDGTTIDNPRYHEKSEKKLKRLQRQRDRRTKGSRGRKETILKLQKLHEHIINQRNNNYHKISRDIVNKNGIIVHENIKFDDLRQGWHGNSIDDAAWGNLFLKIAYKAEDAGRQVIKIEPNLTSQRCSCCGIYAEKDIGRSKVFKCEYCGLVVDRDINAALNIKEFGLSFDNKTERVTANVLSETIVDSRSLVDACS